MLVRGALSMRTLFPPIEPFWTFELPVSPLHTLVVEQCGNPEGVPVVFLHGGPGGGISSHHRSLFDPAFYHIILLDQRGSGQSRPHAELTDNTTWHLVADLEHLRTQLGIDRWLVFGGSWGSTLALAYATRHPKHVWGLILRGIFLCRLQEIRWFYQEGASWLFPEEWERYQSVIPEAERSDMVKAYYRQLTHPDPKVQIKAAKAWSRWEGATCRLIPDTETIDSFEADLHALAMARIECHYFMHNAFFDTDNELLAQAPKLADIPTWIIHGRYDVICPVQNAWLLHQALPQSHLSIISNAGHAYNEPGILDALIAATEAFKMEALKDKRP